MQIGEYTQRRVLHKILRHLRDLLRGEVCKIAPLTTQIVVNSPLEPHAQVANGLVTGCRVSSQVMDPLRIRALGHKGSFRALSIASGAIVIADPLYRIGDRYP